MLYICYDKCSIDSDCKHKGRGFTYLRPSKAVSMRVSLGVPFLVSSFDPWTSASLYRKCPVSVEQIKLTLRKSEVGEACTCRCTAGCSDKHQKISPFKAHSVSLSVSEQFSTRISSTSDPMISAETQVVGNFWCHKDGTCSGDLEAVHNFVLLFSAIYKLCSGVCNKINAGGKWEWCRVNLRLLVARRWRLVLVYHHRVRSTRERLLRHQILLDCNHVYFSFWLTDCLPSGSKLFCSYLSWEDEFEIELKHTPCQN